MSMLRVLWTWAGAACLLLAACSGTPQEASAPGPAAPSAASSVPTTPVAGSSPAAGAKATAAASAAAVPLEACKLVTKQEVVAVAGAVGDAIEEPPLVAMVAGCRFPNIDVPVVAEVSVTLVTWTDAATAATEMKNTIQRNGYEAVSGVGEQAYTTWPLPGVTARQGRYEISITLSPSTDEGKANNVARTRTLLEKALTRLP